MRTLIRGGAHGQGDGDGDGDAAVDEEQSVLLFLYSLVTGGGGVKGSLL